jgi:3',5'-cyclic AMP phosphodiesterase CpdA
MAYPEIFASQTQWIADHRDSIDFALHEGDITQNNADREWENAVSAMSLMDGHVPYAFVTGNHDIGAGGTTDTRNTDLFNRRFPFDKYGKTPHFGGAFEAGRMDNVWHTFRAGGYDWLILALEFGARNCVLDWAGEVVERHPAHKVIVLTHAYMYSDNTRMGEGDQWLPRSYGIGTDTGENAVNDGEQMWEKLVSRYPNILLVCSGHVLNSGTGRLVSEGRHGNKVYQMLANYQMHEKAGNGFLRLIDMDPANRRITVRTYSPYLNEYKTDDENSFVFENVVF